MHDPSDAAPHVVAVLVQPGTVVVDLAVPMQVFGPWPPWITDGGPGAAYRYSTILVAPGPHPRAGDRLVVTGTEPLSRLADADTVVVPGLADPLQPVPDAVCSALADAARRGARIASICVGAFVLAAAGVLDGRPATTHWRWAGELRRRYPAIDVQEQHLYVDDGAVLTSAGLLAGVDLCLHIVRRDLGAHVANGVARFLCSAPHRDGGQAQFIDRPVAVEAGALDGTRRWLLANLAEPHTLVSVARHAGMSVRTLARHFQAETGETVTRWLVQQRITRARELLEVTDRPVVLIARDVGFGSGDAFRAHFHRATGTTPLRYRQAFHRT